MRAVLVLVVVSVLLGFAGRASGASASSGRYVVVPGDTLTVIAQRFGISLTVLARRNRLDVLDPLEIGTVLRVPSPSPPPAPRLPHWPGVYVVRAGDTLSGIASRYDVSVADLGRENGVQASGILLAGAKLKVPAAVPAPAASLPSRVTIAVSAGDTLTAIAARYGVSLDSLTAANHIDLTAPLLVGQQLLIPAGGSSSQPDLTLPQTDPYPQGAAGYDLSYPNCINPPPPADSFAVVGVNGGRPFTSNPCFNSEYAVARASPLLPSVYLNAAYSPTLARHLTPDCRLLGASQQLGPAEQNAYAIGCSEAEASDPLLSAVPTAAIWIDIEPANTWSKRQSLNRAAIEGFLGHLLTRTPRPVVGIYSAASYWQGITGAWNTPAIPEWIATGPVPDPPGCPQPFAAGPVWLSQHTTELDHDIAC